MPGVYLSQDEVYLYPIPTRLKSLRGLMKSLQMGQVCELAYAAFLPCKASYSLDDRGPCCNAKICQASEGRLFFGATCERLVGRKPPNGAVNSLSLSFYPLGIFDDT